MAVSMTRDMTLLCYVEIIGKPRSGLAQGARN
jgi:hypothetical protein